MFAMLFMRSFPDRTALPIKRERFICRPNLPQGKVNCLLIGEKYAPELENPLNNEGVEVIRIPDNLNVDSKLSGHADLSVIHAGENKLILQKRIYIENPDFVDRLVAEGFRVIKTENEQGREYPFDAGLNVCAAGDFMFFNPDYTDPVVFRSMTGCKNITVRQAYAKCSVCVIASGVIISSDPGIISAAEKHSVHFLRITPGHISLPGFNSGFIGGSSFLLSENLIAFTGNLNNHPDGHKIEEFLVERNMKPIYLTKRPLFDIGGAILLKEE